MRVPLSWLKELVPDLTAAADEVAEALVRAGLEVEQVERHGDIANVVVGRVVDVEELTEFLPKKTIRFCHVDTGAGVREVVCGATNFAAGDLVPFALPGAVLPGGFEIATRRTYGRTSDGMICSAAELGLADSSHGILVLETGQLGENVVELLGLRDEVLDIAITPDRGYALSVRGVARETATAFDLAFHDPGLRETPAPDDDGYQVRLDDAGCDRFVARVVRGVDPNAPSPAWLQRRLALAGMRPISLAVDITNHVMLEMGQPLHAYDLATLQGPIVVRRAKAGERLTTLDGQDRALHPADLLITDDSGPIGLAGVMGGASTEISASTADVLVEAAHFTPSAITLTARRHRLPSEASKRFERGVDSALPSAAADLAVQLLVELGGGTAGPVTDNDQRTPPAAVRMPAGLPGRVAGLDYSREIVTHRLEQVGCRVSGEDILEVLPPSWRPDLTGPADLVEEVIRLEGYDAVPVALPTAPAGRGLTAGQRLRRTVARALASSGLVEVVMPPFVADELVEELGLAGYQPPRLLNPLSEEEALLRPALLPGLLTAVLRNVGRGLSDVAIYETGSVFRGSGTPVAEVPKTSQRPTDEELAALDGALPAQPRHAAVALAGNRAGRAVAVGDAVEVLLAAARAIGISLTISRGQDAPYHPGRCAVLLLDGEPIGTAGELHPRVVSHLGLPPRTVVGELDLDRLVRAAAEAGPAPAPVLSTYPPSSVDVALVVADDVLAADVEHRLREGAGELLEEVRLFDVFTGPQVGEGRVSLAYSLRFRAPDRTLTDAEVLAARDAAVAAAGALGAVLRGS
ncbi:MAG: Phenylalanyl-tRNA synthetase beta chain [Frankiales bacterium]|nr:Phenylalanyl-tRNA synthetase beta chain [Frankiales bacterium]